MSKVYDELYRPEDKQVGGNHYKLSPMQPWDIIKAWDMDFWSGNALKYLIRYKHKNGVEDLEKAKHYIEYMIKNYKELYETK
jgi:hypothetical protein